MKANHKSQKRHACAFYLQLLTPVLPSMSGLQLSIELEITPSMTGKKQLKTRWKASF